MPASAREPLYRGSAALSANGVRFLLLLAAFSHGGDLFGNARERRVPLHPVNAHSIACDM
jgi:hypothetical protein